MKISTRYISFVGIIIFALIISQTDIHNIYKIIVNSKIEYIIVSFLIIPLTILLKGLRWKKIIDTVGLKYTIKESCKVSMIGTFVGTLTPGQSGDLIRTLYLQDKNPSSKSLSTIIIDRLFDITSLVILGSTGIAIMFYYFKQELFSLYPVIIIPLLLTMLLTNRRLTRAASYQIFKRLIPEQKKAYLKEFYNEFYNSLQIITKKKKELTYTSMITFSVWILGIIQTYIIISALNIEISFLYVFSFTPIIILINLTPITISGIGTRDISMIFFFSLINIPSTYAISASLLLLAILGTELSGGAILWTQNPREITI